MSANLEAVIILRNEWIAVNHKIPNVVGMPQSLVDEIDPYKNKSSYWSDSFAGMDIFESNELVFKAI